MSFVDAIYNDLSEKYGDFDLNDSTEIKWKIYQNKTERNQTFSQFFQNNIIYLYELNFNKNEAVEIIIFYWNFAFILKGERISFEEIVVADAHGCFKYSIRNNIQTLLNTEYSITHESSPYYNFIIRMRNIFRNIIGQEEIDILSYILVGSSDFTQNININTNNIFEYINNIISKWKYIFIKISPKYDIMGILVTIDSYPLYY